MCYYRSCTKSYGNNPSAKCRKLGYTLMLNIFAVVKLLCFKTKLGHYQITCALFPTADICNTEVLWKQKRSKLPRSRAAGH